MFIFAMNIHVLLDTTCHTKLYPDFKCERFQIGSEVEAYFTVTYAQLNAHSLISYFSQFNILVIW